MFETTERVVPNSSERRINPAERRRATKVRLNDAPSKELSWSQVRGKLAVVVAIRQSPFQSLSLTLRRQIRDSNVRSDKRKGNCKKGKKRDRRWLRDIGSVLDYVAEYVILLAVLVLRSGVISDQDVRFVVERITRLTRILVCVGARHCRTGTVATPENSFFCFHPSPLITDAFATDPSGRVTGH